METVALKNAIIAKRIAEIISAAPPDKKTKAATVATKHAARIIQKRKNERSNV